MHIGDCQVFKLLINAGSNINILYGGSRQDGHPRDGLGHDQPTTRSCLDKFYGNETRSPGIVLLPVWADPYNVIMEFYVIDVEFLTTQSSGGF